ncbi:MAG: hypothetical protein M3Z64_00455 [Verrucomicrobiota bacterium]|nr:hypothetical protein [Verrucomicrobiota bacterium]
MKTFTSPLGKFCTSVACLFLGSSSALLASDLVLQKVPPLTIEQAPAYPENVARQALGAKVEAATAVSNLQVTSTSGAAPEAALLCGDPTAGYTLPAGVTTLLVSLPKIENVETISFLNTAAKGDVTVSTASAKLPADSPQWHVVSKEEINGNAVKAKIGPSEAKYVKLTFNVKESGRIAAFGVYASPAVSDFTMPRQRQLPSADQPLTFAMVNYNMSNVHTKARALYVSSGADMKQANSMIDDQPSTSYTFAAGDGSPTTVIDLGQVRTLNRVSAIYAANKGSMDVYVLPAIPGAGDDAAPASLPNTVKISEQTIAAMKPVASATDDGAQGRASVNFAATTGRYVMLRWNPAIQQDGAFTVAEVAAFGGNTDDQVVATKRRHNDVSDGKTVADSKDMADAKDMADVPAEGPGEEAAPPAEGPPPSLPQPPPFTFIPQVLPNSP